MSLPAETAAAVAPRGANPIDPPAEAQGGLRVTLGQHARAGASGAMRDFHGAILPEGAARSLKGVALVVADGISSSPRGAGAAETAVKAFLSDYYDTPDGWAVREAAARVIRATNAWLNAETRRHELAHERGHVCTFDAVVVKGRIAHVFHVGDGRVWRLSGATLEPLTEDHRHPLPGAGNALGRALGMARDVEIDHRRVPVGPGDVLVVTTDGIHDVLPPQQMAALAARAAPDAAAAALVEAARAAGGQDDMTAQVLRIDGVPEAGPSDLLDGAAGLPPPPSLDGRRELDGWRLLRRLHFSARSQVWLVEDPDTGTRAALKVPSAEARQEPGQLRRLLMEEWVARRVASPHLLGPPAASRPRACVYALSEHVEGTSLRQWMTDRPAPELDAVRGIVEQIAAGLRALHRRGIVHQDLRPENVLIDAAGTVRLIDYGSVKVAGVSEADPAGAGEDELLGMVQYTAPECLLGHPSSPRSDQFSLAVLTYEMLEGGLPYGTAAARVRHRRDLRRLSWRPAGGRLRAVPDWMDAALATAAHPDPERRFAALSEFTAALRRPDRRLVPRSRAPLAERDPVRFWQATTLLFAVAALVLLVTR